jgi:DNA-binding NarL/FixJ family response regulator
MGEARQGVCVVGDAVQYKFIIADDHPLFRGALRQTLEGMFEGLEIEESGSLDDVTDALDSSDSVDLILLDLSMPGMRGYSGLMYLRAHYPSVPVVIVSAVEEPVVVRRCIQFGAAGYIPKSLDTNTIRAGISVILGGGQWVAPDIDLDEESDENSNLVGRLATLTPQQVRVLMMLSEGLLNKQIAYELSVSEATIKAHVSAILQKLDVDSRTQAVIAAAKLEAGQWQSLEGPGRS